MKYLFFLSVLFYSSTLNAQTVEIRGYLKIDSVKTGTQTDSFLVIKNGEIKKVVIIPVLTDVEMFGMYNPPQGVIIYNISDHKLFIFTGANWEMINSMVKFE